MDFRFKFALIFLILIILVVVLGLQIWQKDKKVSFPSSTSNSNIEYINVKYGYKLDYPAEWNLMESSDFSTAQWRGAGLVFQIAVRDNLQKKPVKDFLIEENYLSGYRIIQENIRISGQDVVKAKFVWEKQYPNETILFFNSPGNNYFFNVLDPKGNMLDEVMATFRFIR